MAHIEDMPFTGSKTPGFGQENTIILVKLYAQ